MNLTIIHKLTHYGNLMQNISLFGYNNTVSQTLILMEFISTITNSLLMSESVYI